MPHTKIATCCYCGTRAALVLRGENRHELCCSSCGAPLHNLKRLRADAVGTGSRKPVRGRTSQNDIHATPLPAWERKALAQAHGRKKKHKKKKKSKGLAHRFFEEAFDVLEDILD